MFRLQTTPESIIWAVREIRESVDDLLNLLQKKELYLPYLSQITSESRKKEWLTVRVLLREMLGEEKEILYTSSGKPYLSDNTYQISISHTKGFVAVSLHPEMKIGIDIEHISPRIHKIRSRFMNENEEMNLNKEHEETHLLLHWSAKESIFKMLGEQDVDFKTDLHINPFHPVLNDLSRFSAYETKTEQQHRFAGYYLANSLYVLTVVYYLCATIPK
ncbi:MAG: 4'-phosphopantetheinyl transferase superfamily protein [Dysgonamonadaceae bacterium]|jgi:phosphopantetheine--protein transferase-like protein|nr:4'-phosphopantetheinyl transferase superfamily protein [Dysgonamonadaceae bacterium]